MQRMAGPACWPRLFVLKRRRDSAAINISGPLSVEIRRWRNVQGGWAGWPSLGYTGSPISLNAPVTLPGPSLQGQESTRSVVWRLLIAAHPPGMRHFDKILSCKYTSLAVTAGIVTGFTACADAQAGERGYTDAVLPADQRQRCPDRHRAWVRGGQPPLVYTPARCLVRCPIDSKVLAAQGPLYLGAFVFDLGR